MPYLAVERTSAGTNQQPAPNISRRPFAVIVATLKIYKAAFLPFALHELLYPVKFLLGDDRLVSAFYPQTFNLSKIVDFLLFEKIWRELLVILDDACIERVFEYLADI